MNELKARALADAEANRILGIAPDPNRRERGRPSIYSDTLADRICELLADAPHGLDHVIKAHDELPDRATIYRWAASNEDFRDKLALAQENRAHLLVDQSVEIADDDREDAVNNMAVQRAGLRVNTRLKAAALLAPRRYGRQLNVSGNVGLDLRALLAMSYQIEEEAARLGSPDRAAIEDKRED